MSVIPSPKLPLGKVSSVPDHYDPGLLYPVPRQVGRAAFLPEGDVPFQGRDRWDCFEVSWLNAQGVPQSTYASIQYTAHSPNIVESKSLKLYLTGFHNTRYDSPQALASIITTDLAQALQTSDIHCQIFSFEQMAAPTGYNSLGQCLDGLDIQDLDFSTVAAANAQQFLRCNKIAPPVEEQLYSHGLRSLCPVTSQPDWATVVIRYRGCPIEPASLFRYLAAYRNHQGFHEACCEQMFVDILAACEPTELAIGCYFARRGGIAITPIRYLSDRTFSEDLFTIRLDRQ